MTDRIAPQDPSDPPGDVASLYSWANLHGANYRDFSVSRAQAREKARLRAQQAIEQERQREQSEAEARHAEAVRQPAETAPVKEPEPQPEAEEPPAVQAPVRHAAQPAAQHAAQPAPWQRAIQELFPARTLYTAQPSPGPQPAGPDCPEKPGTAPAAAFHPAGSSRRADFAPAQQPDNAPPAARTSWSAGRLSDGPARPAWLVEKPRPPVPPGPARSPEDTIQGSRDRLTSRWFALKGVLEGSSGVVEPAPAPSASRAPVLAVFSLAGGVGKTSVVATVGRALSSRGERVLLVDMAAFGLLPFFFGARDQRPRQLRTFSPPTASGDAPIQMIAVDPESLEPENGGDEAFASEIQQYFRGVSRVIVDLATASGSITRRILRLSPLVLVPLIPDMNSVVGAGSIDAFFEHNGSAAGKPLLPYYVLNQFDASLPLHLDVREVLREQLGDRLLPFALRRAPAVSEALAEGMTVMDYAPNSPVAEDFGNLAAWVKSQSAPAASGFRGVRWSER